MNGVIWSVGVEEITVDVGGAKRRVTLNTDVNPGTGKPYQPYITLNGKQCNLTDLRMGDRVEVDGNPAVKISATRRS